MNLEMYKAPTERVKKAESSEKGKNNSNNEREWMDEDSYQTRSACTKTQ